MERLFTLAQTTIGTMDGGFTIRVATGADTEQTSFLELAG
jgi:hypothetical protein